MSAKFITMASSDSTIQNMPALISQETDVEMEQIVVHNDSNRITATLMPPPKSVNNLPLKSNDRMIVHMNQILVMKTDLLLV